MILCGITLLWQLNIFRSVLWLLAFYALYGQRTAAYLYFLVVGGGDGVVAATNIQILQIQFDSTDVT